MAIMSTTTQVVTKTRTVEVQVPNIARITDQRFVGFSETTGFLYQEISDGTIRLRLGDNAPYPALGETIWFEHDTPAGSAERAHFTVESYTGSNSNGQFCSVDFDGDSNGTLQHPGWYGGPNDKHRVLDYSNDAPCGWFRFGYYIEISGDTPGTARRHRPAHRPLLLADPA